MINTKKKCTLNKGVWMPGKRKQTKKGITTPSKPGKCLIDRTFSDDKDYISKETIGRALYASKVASTKLDDQKDADEIKNYDKELADLERGRYNGEHGYQYYRTAKTEDKQGYDDVYQFMKPELEGEKDAHYRAIAEKFVKKFGKKSSSRKSQN
jgi:hypothetical protein